MTRSRRSAPTWRRTRIPIAAELTAPALAEGGDTLWLDDTTLVVGLGYRTNATEPHRSRSRSRRSTCSRSTSRTTAAAARCSTCCR